jgi:hypothetical protein
MPTCGTGWLPTVLILAPMPLGGACPRGEGLGGEGLLARTRGRKNLQLDNSKTISLTLRRKLGHYQFFLEWPPMFRGYGLLCAPFYRLAKSKGNGKPYPYNPTRFFPPMWVN